MSEAISTDRRPAPVVEAGRHRAWVCRARPAEPAGAAAAGVNGGCLSAEVWTVSRRGALLVVPERFDPGSLLWVWTDQASERGALAALLRVVHVLPTVRPDGPQWVTGCDYPAEGGPQESRGA